MHYMNQKYAAQKHAEDMARAAQERLARSVPRKPNQLLNRLERRSWVLLVRPLPVKRPRYQPGREVTGPDAFQVMAAMKEEEHS